MIDTPLSPAQQRAVLVEMQAEWQRRQYSLGVALRVLERIGQGAEAQAEQIKGISECVIALDVIAELLRALPAVGAPASVNGVGSLAARLDSDP